ncbi:RING-H2 finger protein ATL79-like [Lolium rigidum]|uniref:RING-H2 finger protein ATL79-like n=1 Tax=Lolium rigidum TaxID=89674 RepID=UPI001F5DB494|nr:RING-H2 finger protein ATL79-like [Lolium rigidum]
MESSTATQTERHGRGNATATTIAKSRWGPYSGAGDFAGNMAVILASLLAALALALALHAGVRHLLRRRRRQRQTNGGQAPDPEKPPPVAPALLELVYSAAEAGQLAGAASECAICLAEFADGDAVRAVPACGHGFHARCIERWLAPGGRRSSCPTCRAPASTPLASASAGAPAAAAS